MLEWLLLAVLSVLPYLVSMFGELVFDDTALLNNLWIQHGQVRSWIKRRTWRPLTYLSFLLNVRLFGGVYPGQKRDSRRKALFGFHLGGMLFHTVNAFVLWWAVRQFGIAHAYAIALIFAAHPLCSQSVAYISGRYSVLAGAFAFLALGLMGANHAVLACISLVLACAAKEDTAAMFPVLAIAGWIFSRDLAWLPLLIPVLLGIWKYPRLKELLQQNGGSHVESCGFPAQLKTPRYQIVAFTLHMMKMPGLAIGYGQSADHETKLSSLYVARSAAAIAVAILLLSFGNPVLMLAVLLIFIPLVPYILVPMPDPIMEQRMYISTAGIAIVIGSIVPSSTFPAIIAVFTGMAVCRAWYWRSQIDLWMSVILNGGRKDRALINLGGAYLEEQRFKETRECCQEALELNPNLSIARCNLASVEWQSSHIEEALEHVEEATRRTPNFMQAHFLHGRILETAKRFEEAAAAYERCVAIQDFPAAWNRLGLIRLSQARIADGGKCFRTAIRDDPNTLAYAWNNALTLELEGEHEASITQLKKLPVQIRMNDDMLVLRKA